MSMPAEENGSLILEGLNCEQRQAVQHGDRPLLIVAGAGTGKTKTLVHRVAQQIQQGIAPGRILLLTFTRRAAAEMLRRVDGLLRQLHGNGRQHGGGSHIQAVWGGTFHATAARLLRLYAPAAGLEPAFTILDRSDSEDLLDVVRTELGLSKTDQRFPRKGTCLAIYSHCVNSQQPLEDVLAAQFPWCREQAADLKRLFAAYGERKEQGGILDYDDLLLFWRGLLADPQAGPQIRSRFDCVLVDEYQDTNRVQAEILKLLRPDGQGLTAVGDDAQSIYSFRAATVRNILDFPAEFPGATIVKLEQNYRSTQPILTATNQVIGQAQRRFRKDLWSSPRRRRIAATGHLPGRERPGGVRDPRDPPAARGRHRPAAASGPVSDLAPQRAAGRRIDSPQHPVRQVRRPQVPGGGPHQGSAVAAPAGRKPARPGRRHPRAATAARHRPQTGSAADGVDRCRRAAIGESGRSAAVGNAAGADLASVAGRAPAAHPPAGHGPRRRKCRSPAASTNRSCRTSTTTPRRGNATWSKSSSWPRGSPTASRC